ncbi:LysR family transcriptional regulator [Rhizobium leguminosarum]|uniref:LysR substrate-binding domain-containing protein n=1 Tax=Rhizobium leguminosarum TaxID=384 RepID=UPI001C978DB3|nr:LysR substrate-binding domain-containing protein [Rhizobium leguminosarum]MBY5701176.1 LysR family transcriptional regulator [Rhizobium leguminosarum]
MVRPLNSRHIEAFRAVMMSGTTTGAAQLLNTTQPAVSRTLAQLQSATGIKLFEIQRGRLVPTPEAKELFDSVQRHFLGLEKIEQTVSALRQGGTGLLRIACTPVLGMSVIPAITQEFRQEFPKVRVSLHTIETHLMQDGLLSGMYDLALSTSSLNSTGLDPELVHQSQAVCVMSKLHPLTTKKIIQIEDLSYYPLLTHHQDDTLQRRLDHLLTKKGVIPSSVIETNYSATICTLAAANLGLGVISPYAARVFSSLIHVADFHPRIPVQTEMAFPPNMAQSKLAVVFAESAREVFQKLT